MSGDAKPVVVRVKRKPTQEPLAAFWLEINDRPLKRPLLDYFSSLNISDDATGDTIRAKKLLVQHIETVGDSEAAKDVLQSLLINYTTPERWQKCIEERRHMLRKVGKHEQLHSVAIRKHEDFARNARFEQIWQKRRSKKDLNNSLLEGCQLYDIARVDGEDEILDKEQESGSHTAEDDAILCNYLPLLRECIPTAAAEIEAELISRQGNYVYDIYTMEEEMDWSNESNFAEYPLVQVNEADDFYDGQSGSEYDSDDSNADRSELHDYPDEEPSEGSQQDEDEEDGYDDRQESGSEYEGTVEGDEEEMESLRWKHCKCSSI